MLSLYLNTPLQAQLEDLPVLPDHRSGYQTFEPNRLRPIGFRSRPSWMSPTRL